MSVDRDPTYAKVATLACSILLVLCLAMASIAEGQVPKAEWTPGAHLWLARAMVAEAGWTAEKDHIAIAYVIKRRWQQVRRRYPDGGWTYERQTRAYCKGLHAARLNERQRWIHALMAQHELVGEVPAVEFAGGNRVSGSGGPPIGWPAGANWPTVHLPLWRTILKRAADFAAGRLKDPAPGATHWAGHTDRLPGSYVLVADWGVNKFFYTRAKR